MLEDIKEIAEDSWITTKRIIIGILIGVGNVIFIKYILLPIVSIVSDFVTYMLSMAF